MNIPNIYGLRKGYIIPTYYYGKLRMQLKLLYNYMPYRVPIPESAVLKWFNGVLYLK